MKYVVNEIKSPTPKKRKKIVVTTVAKMPHRLGVPESRNEVTKSEGALSAWNEVQAQLS
jgi:hypothetical protein